MLKLKVCKYTTCEKLPERRVLSIENT